MAAMRVYEVARTPATPEQIGAAIDAVVPRRKRVGSVLWGLCAGAAGIGLSVVSFFLIQDTTVSSIVAVVALLGGLVLLTMAAMKMGSNRLELRLLRDSMSDLSRTSDVIVEIEAARITSAASIDDDANAIILHDGCGGGVYINSHRLYELGEEGRKYPSIWRLTLTAREGSITGWETSGPLVEVETDGAGLLEGAPAWGEAVVLDSATPAAWKKLFPSRADE